MFAIILAALAVDFTAATGEIRPELHSSGFGPKICSQTAQELADIKSMGFKAARTHDWAHINSNERVCDYFHIFPLMRLDANDPENYVFGPTDYLLKQTREEAGLDVFYRLGTSIEHSGSKVHFNTKIPDDFDKMAEIFAATGVDGRKQLLVIDYGGTGRRISLDIKGVSDGLNVRCRVLDYTHDLEPIDVSFKDGKLELVKPDFHSAAFIAEFDSRPFHLESAGQ